MNDTKWRELCFAFSSCEKKPAWRTLDVGPDYCTIEWLEIDPKDCPETQVRDLLGTVGVPFEHAEYFKVFGYKQSGNSSKLQK